MSSFRDSRPGTWLRFRKKSDYMTCHWSSLTFVHRPRSSLCPSSHVCPVWLQPPAMLTLWWIIQCSWQTVLDPHLRWCMSLGLCLLTLSSSVYLSVCLSVLTVTFLWPLECLLIIDHCNRSQRWARFEHARTLKIGQEVRYSWELSCHTLLNSKTVGGTSWLHWRMFWNVELSPRVLVTSACSLVAPSSGEIASS